ncbi:Uncharacterized protein Fot_03302 [Forsythia ovata]|uniref:Uncharacterized protein n=1 Tax=Forsythia ovata TaxID=205694 RepID=A0ABD1XCD4_9LAMI
MRLLTEEKDKLKVDLSATECNVAEFSKRSDLANQAQEITAKALEEDGLLDKICQLEEVAESLRSDNLSLKANTEKAVKAGIEDFRRQFKFTSDYENLHAFFVNFGTRQALTEVKEHHLDLDLSTTEANYPSPEEVEDGLGQPYVDGAEGSAGQPPAEEAYDRIFMPARRKSNGFMFS